MTKLATPLQDVPVAPADAGAGLLLSTALTIAEVALRLRVSETSVRRWVSARRLEAYRVGPQAQVRIPAEALSTIVRPAGRPCEGGY
jgi:excisionase family DNA binding protein